MGKQFYNDLYHDVNAVDAVIGHCPWSIRVPRYMGDVTGIFFVVLFNIARGFENVYEIILD